MMIDDEKGASGTNPTTAVETTLYKRNLALEKNRICVTWHVSFQSRLPSPLFFHNGSLAPQRGDCTERADSKTHGALFGVFCRD